MSEEDLGLSDVNTDPSHDAKPSLRGKLKAIAFIAIVIAVECLVAYLYIPSSTETAAMAGATLGIDPETGKLEENPYADQDDGDGIDIETAEVDLGRFSVTSFQPVSNTTLRIDFQLFGTIALADEQEFVARMEENRHRFREAVIVTIRGADITDFTEAQLGLIKRKILEKTNRILGKPLMRGIIFSEFSFIEQ